MINKRVVIIGAGASGLAAGTKLLANGFKNVVILEAEHRIGGRIHTIPFAANVVDLGAQWCHGEQNNIVFELGESLDSFSSNSARNDRMLLIESSGTWVHQPIADHLMDVVLSILDSNDLDDFGGSLGTFITERYNETVLKEDLDPTLAIEFIEFFQRLQSSFDAYYSWFDVSCKRYTEYKTCPGDVLLNWKDEGYCKVIELIKKNFSISSTGLNACIHLGQEVSQINYRTDETASIVEVKCTDGTAYEADHVISTISLGVLKHQHLKLFNPSLPPSKVKAIEALGFGATAKIFIEFEKPFWPSDWHGFGILWRVGHLEHLCHETSLQWLGSIFRFVSVDYQPNLLCARVSGEMTAHVESITDDELIKGLLILLRTFVKNWEIPRPIGIARSEWFSNSHFHGSYSHYSMKSENTKVSDLVSPISKPSGCPIIQFAGEATHEHFYSTVHGAIETGIREATRIMQFYKVPIVQNNSKIKKHNQNDETHRDVVDVLILGAGLAGLGAATALKQNANEKCSFLVLEGQARAGGRINTLDLEDYKSAMGANEQIFIDAGAQWLHGKYNYLHDLSVKYDLLSAEQSEEGQGIYFREHGVKINEYFVKKIDFVIGEILEQCEEYARVAIDQPYPKSVEHFLRERFAEFLQTLENDDEKELARGLFDWHLRFQIIDNSCLSLSHVSAKYWGKYSFNGESCQAHYNFRNGFGDAISNLIKDLGPTNVLFQKEVTEITVAVVDHSDGEDNDDDVDIKPRISVKCSDGSIYKANHVLVTFSLGVLKACYRTMFHPRLPNRIERAICDIGFETINKLFIQFDEPWWGDTDGIQLVFEDDGSVKTSKHKAHWTRWISGFDVMKPGPSNTLLGWVGGSGAIDMEALTDQQIIQDCVNLLSQFTKTKVPAPKRYYCTRWRSNSFIRGAYSYISTDCDTSETSSSQLAEAIYQKDFRTDLMGAKPQGDAIKIDGLSLTDIVDSRKPLNINDLHSQLTNAGHLTKSPVMLFAGEACHEQYFSTAHGAFLSGMEQAQKIQQYYK